jgi:transposase-like protein
MSKICTHSPEFEARLAMEVINCHKTSKKIAADPAIHPSQASDWSRQFLHSARELISRCKKSKDTVESKSRRSEVLQQPQRFRMKALGDP